MGGTPIVVGQRFPLNQLASSLARELVSKHKEGSTEMLSSLEHLLFLHRTWV